MNVTNKLNLKSRYKIVFHIDFDEPFNLYESLLSYSWMEKIISALFWTAMQLDEKIYEAFKKYQTLCSFYYSCCKIKIFCICFWNPIFFKCTGSTLSSSIPWGLVKKLPMYLISKNTWIMTRFSTNHYFFTSPFSFNSLSSCRDCSIPYDKTRTLLEDNGKEFSTMTIFYIGPHQNFKHFKILSVAYEKLKVKSWRSY